MIMRNLLSIGMISEPEYNFNRHQHTTWEIVYYTHGTGILKIGSTDVHFEPGDIICQPPGIPHSEHAKDGYRNIFLEVGELGDFGVVIPCFKDNANKAYYILLQIYNEFHIRSKNWKNIIESLLDALYQYMISWSCEKRKTFLVENFEIILVSNIANKHFKVKEAVKNVPFTTNHFRYLFKNETGRTPLDYLIEKRIDYAKHLLESRYFKFTTIKEVANRAGFDDPYYFSRVFKKITGKSPTEWSTENVDITDEATGINHSF